MKNDSTSVLYIAGLGRSGSTILSNILNQHESLFSAGEIRWIWERGLLRNEACGCGELIHECETWNNIFYKAFGGMDKINAVEMDNIRKQSNRTRMLPVFILFRKSNLLKRFYENYLSSLDKLYSAMTKTASGNVVVDASKLPTYASLLEMVPTINLMIVHLVRDPRAVAYSWLRKKIRPETGKPMVRFNPIKSTLLWIVWNVAVEILWGREVNGTRYLRVRYEDFISKPYATITKILHFAGESTSHPFINDSKVELAHTHSVSGNPMRFQQGPVELSADLEWKSKMQFSTKLLITLLTWPLLLRYRYHITNQNQPG